MAGSVITATIRISPWRRGQVSGSTSKVRQSSSAQRNRAARSDQSTGSTIATGASAAALACRRRAPRVAEVDALGGAARAIERGFFQEAIARSAYEIQKAQESGDAVVVGVNRFSDGSPPAAIETPDFSALEIQQKTRLAAVRGRRDPVAVESARDPG
jgi:hypothetical protein